MAHRTLIDLTTRYARPPAQTTIDRAVAAHEGVRQLFGDRDYLTFLQGSYKNDTALWELNDVDIVVLSRGVVSTRFTGQTATHPVTWEEIFSRIERTLQSDRRYAGRWERKDKCIRINTDMRLDIVPAVRIGDPDTDPIAIYSHRAQQERKNSPRDHYRAGADKSGRTSGEYKQMVRLFKRWAKCWFGDRKVAPSFYLECLVHAFPDSYFTGNLPLDFCTFATGICSLDYATTRLPNVSGASNLMADGEWGATMFWEFQRTLGACLPRIRAAVDETSDAATRTAWITAFNGQQPS